MIKGVGTDLVEKRRIKNALSKFGDKFIERVLTEKKKRSIKVKLLYIKRFLLLAIILLAKKQLLRH